MMGDIFGNLGNIKASVDEAKTRLTAFRLDEKSNCGRITICVDGNQKVIDITIHENFEDQEELADTMCNTMNRALEKSKAKMTEELQNATGGLMGSLPGL